MILVVEDQARTCRELQRGLAHAGFEVRGVRDAESARTVLQQEPVEALVVDILLPGQSGLDFVRDLRGGGVGLPVLFLSAKGALEDRLAGLEAGGDDYLPKPYSILEVVARLRGLLRRGPGWPPAPVRAVADLTWDPATRRVERAGRRLDLTAHEYALLVLLLEHAGEVVPRSRIVQAVWGLDGAVDANALDVQILRLRRKVDGPCALKLIHTLRGVGLVLEPRDDA